jgi:nitroimidazol reductase NimA-like FMN-containing flavoprotein (pyridoxamine 5'-phosphate oxidase superfamily)
MIDMETDRNGLQVLGREECFGLLGNAVIGRLGLSSGALPVVLPVNFLVDGDRVLIRTSPGTKLDRALAGAVVAFEVDDFDPLSHTGWSVLVTGVANVVDDADDLARIRRLPLAHWAHGAADRVVAVSAEIVTGRRLGTPPAAAGAA